MGLNVRLRTTVAVLAGVVLWLPGTASAAEVPCSAHSDTRLASMTDEGIGLTSAIGLASGRYALPTSSAPTQLVVMFHGHGNDSCSWRRHLQQASARGAVAVAMDYTGQRQTPVENYGWFVREGAEDSILAAKHFLAVYPSITEVYAFGISMGGQAAALAAASPMAVRTEGSPLFDYLIDVEGVNNIIEEYLIARAVAPVNSGGALAQQEIEEENGGSLETAPDRYRDMNPVEQAPQMKDLKGVVLVNAVDDGLVPTNQSREMFFALALQGVTSHLYTVLARGDGEAGTTGTGIVGGPVFTAAGSEYPAPLAGHGWEGSDTHLVIKTGFDQLWALMAGGSIVTGETLVPGV